jgi:hypothetical protein
MNILTIRGKDTVAVYDTCTTKAPFVHLSSFWNIAKSITYTISTPPRGSNPTLTASQLVEKYREQ